MRPATCPLEVAYTLAGRVLRCPYCGFEMSSDQPPERVARGCPASAAVLTERLAGLRDRLANRRRMGLQEIPSQALDARLAVCDGCEHFRGNACARRRGCQADEQLLRELGAAEPACKNWAR